MKVLNLSVLHLKVIDPQLWFTRVDNYFLAKRINLQRDKLGNASTHLSDDVADNVREALAKLDPERQYDVLKQAVI